MKPRQLCITDTMAAQLDYPAIKPRPRADGADIACVAHKRRGKRGLIIIAVMRKHRDGCPRIGRESGKRCAGIAAMIGKTGEGGLFRSASRDQRDLPAKRLR